MECAETDHKTRSTGGAPLPPPWPCSRLHSRSRTAPALDQDHTQPPRYTSHSPPFRYITTWKLLKAQVIRGAQLDGWSTPQARVHAGPCQVRARPPTAALPPSLGRTEGAHRAPGTSSQADTACPEEKAVCPGQDSWRKAVPYSENASEALVTN